MKEIRWKREELRGCERQEFDKAAEKAWRWKAGGCPHGKEDLDAGCTACLHYVVRGVSESSTSPAEAFGVTEELAQRPPPPPPPAPEPEPEPEGDGYPGV